MKNGFEVNLPITSKKEEILYMRGCIFGHI